MTLRWWRCDPSYISDVELLQLTGLGRPSFDRLVVELQPAWQEAHDRLVESRRKSARKKAPGAGRPGLEFPSRLFIVLVALRSGSTYRSLEAQYRVGKDTIGRSVEEMCMVVPSLGITQSDGNVVLNEEVLVELLEGMAGTSGDENEPDGISGAVIIDGTFTQVGRPCGWDQQRLFYSFFRRVHCLVFQTCTNLRGDLLWLSGPFPGSTHDLTALEASPLSEFIKRTKVPVIADKGYQGIGSRLGLDEKHPVFLPYKKPRNGELDRIDKLMNSTQASIRVKVEHIHAAIKNWKILRHYRGQHERFAAVIGSVGVLSTLKYRT